jgi:hypothetical protein
MSDDSLVDIVIAGCQQFHNLIPHVIELRERFNSRPRGAANIAGCQTWTEFCEKKLDRKIRAVQTAIAAFTNPAVAPKPKSRPSEITDEQLENYEYANRIEVRKLAKNFLDSGMPSEDAIGALVGLEVPEPYAKASVRILTGSAITPVQEPEAERDRLLRLFTTPPLGLCHVGGECIPYFKLTLKIRTEEDVAALAAALNRGRELPALLRLADMNAEEIRKAIRDGVKARLAEIQAKLAAASVTPIAAPEPPLQPEPAKPKKSSKREPQPADAYDAALENVE